MQTLAVLRTVWVVMMLGWALLAVFRMPVGFLFYATVAATEAGYLLEANAERHLKTPDEMARLFRDHPQALANTLAIAKASLLPVPEDAAASAVTSLLAWDGSRPTNGSAAA